MLAPLPDWRFAIEVHPPDWHFPAGDSWLAGWIFAGPNDFISDLRAWVDDRPVLGLPGQPKPGLDEKLLGRPGPPYAGFVFRLTPHQKATQLRLEARDATGIWREFYQTPISVAGGAPHRPTTSSLGSCLPDLTLALFRLRYQRPESSFKDLADEVSSSTVAEPLNSLPNPPFHGALEEPGETGRLRYGRVAVTGWLTHRTEKITRITALADALHESTLLHGLPRNDIDGVFTDLPGSANAAFVGQVDLPANQGRPVLLKVFAELANGERHLAFAQRFTPLTLAGPVPPLPPFSRLDFALSLWALRRSAQKLGMARDSVRGFLAAVESAWSAYRNAAPARVPANTVKPAPTSQTENKTPLRLLVVTHNLNFEGAPRLIFELARHLTRQPGTSARVLSPQEGPLRTLFEEAGMPVEIVDVSGLSAAKAPANLFEILAQTVAVDWSEIDLVLANTMVSFWAVHAAQKAGKPSVFYVHESAPADRFFDPTLVPMVESAFRTATRVAFTADSSRTVFSGLEHARNFRVLPSWLDVAAMDTFATTHTKAELREKHGIAPDAVVLLNLGTVCERKGQHTFIRAVARLVPLLQQQQPDQSFQFIMVGARSDQYCELLRLQTADAGLHQVRFIPETRENFDWLRLADILVCTSFEESSPRVLLEAATFGLPIVSTNVHGIVEMLSEKEAWLVAPGDPSELADAMGRAVSAYLAHDSTRATHARQTVVNRYDERVSLPQHHALAIEAHTCIT